MKKVIILSGYFCFLLSITFTATDTAFAQTGCGGCGQPPCKTVSHYPFNGNINDEGDADNDGSLVWNARLTHDQFGIEKCAYI